MKKKILFVTMIVLLLSLLLVGIVQADGARCYAVSGDIDQVVGVSGTISGDLEGTFAAIGGPPVFHGAVIMRPVEQIWEITGGTVEPLIGETVVFEVSFVGIFAKPGLLSINNTARVVEGAYEGNLTQHGWTSLIGPPYINHLDYHGMICP